MSSESESSETERLTTFATTSITDSNCDNEYNAKSYEDDSSISALLCKSRKYLNISLITVVV